MTIIVQKRKMTFLEKIYIYEILRGLIITMRHLIKNILFPGKMMTYQYPDEIKPIPSTHRSEHRLMQRPDGSVRCTACMLCATACPSNCIHIEAAEGKTPEMEKYPTQYIINQLRCIYCGFCVEACPCDAIRMDTGKLVESRYRREDFFKDITYLKNNHPEGLSPVSEGIY